MRSQIFFAAALLSTAAIAQKTAPKLVENPSDRTSAQTIDLKNIELVASTAGPGTVDVNWDGSVSNQVAIVMDRDFRDAIQGDMDRETIERANGEIR